MKEEWSHCHEDVKLSTEAIIDMAHSYSGETYECYKNFL